MANLKKLTLIDSETNREYEVEVSEEIYTRAHMDMIFATKLLDVRMNEGIQIFQNINLIEKNKQNVPSSNATSSRALSPIPSTSRDVQSAIHNWKQDEVLLLIATYKEYQIAFLDENSSKAEVWSSIDMNAALAQHGLPPINEKKCRTKMDTLKRQYKTLKDSNKKSGNKRISWPYYDEMEELFGEQPWVKPLSTAGSNVANQMESEPPAKKQKTLRHYCERLLEERKKREEVRERHHREKIEAINRLTDVVATLISKKKIPNKAKKCFGSPTS